ncbi:hypothetical protein EYE40_06865 [Glaciihabitans arcticus]|uniref:LPXTG cell wall anchor domain-containing protein n=1 Tax=Glaciihabitans arcticus TaxID=2668039 RepID=A0A4Q9GRE8_9MICO|nr:hypothetical protein [Glaciihabitans arcticus]TBN57145.1 hypothetical protein EYE40_06865 [Glaciihabitans arcticus]
MNTTRTKRGLIIALAALVFSSSALSASAATPPVGVFPTWTATGTGFDATFAGASTIPVAHLTTTSATTPTIAQGASAFLGANTGFGDRFGSSRKQPYLTISAASVVTPSATTLTFDAPTVPGWGFALGDVDADYVSIQAFNGATPLTTAELGFQTPGNYCLNASPKPTGCSNITVTDAPAWCGAPTPVPGCATRPVDTYLGTGLDTQGAYGWLVPTVPVTRVVLTYGVLIGFPSFQLWLAAVSPAATVTGEVVIGGGDDVPVPAGTSLTLLDSAGTPVTDVLDEPVLVPVAPDGTFEFETAFGDYQLDLVAPPEVVVEPGLFPVPLAANADVVDLGDLLAAPLIPAAPGDPGDSLVPTGVDATFPAILAGLGLLGGGFAIWLARRRGSAGPAPAPGRRR